MTLSKPILKHNFIDDLRHIGWIILSVFGISILIGILSGGNASLGGLEFIFGFILLVGWAESFAEDLHFYTQLGVSRRTISTSVMVAMLISSAVFTAAFMVTVGLLSLVSLAIPVDFLSVSTFYTQYLADSMGAISGFLVHFVWTWAILLTFGAVGWFGASLYYILSKLGRYIALGVIIFTFVGVPNFLLPRLFDLESVIEAFVNLIVYGQSGNWGSPGASIIGALIAAAACLVGSWLCMRRCKMKK